MRGLHVGDVAVCIFQVTQPVSQVQYHLLQSVYFRPLFADGFIQAFNGLMLEGELAFQLGQAVIFDIVRHMGVPVSIRLPYRTGLSVLARIRRRKAGSFGVTWRIFLLALGYLPRVRRIQRSMCGLKAATARPMAIRITPVGMGKGRVIAPSTRRIRLRGSAAHFNIYFIFFIQASELQTLSAFLPPYYHKFMTVTMLEPFSWSIILILSYPRRRVSRAE